MGCGRRSQAADATLAIAPSLDPERVAKQLASFFGGSEAGFDVRWGAACLLAGALVLGVSAKPACAEDVSRGGGGWTFHVTPYAWATAFNGNATIRGQKSDVDASFSDVIQDLDYGLLAQIEADKGPWGLVAQGNYLNASSDGSVGPVDARSTPTRLSASCLGPIASATGRSAQAQPRAMRPRASNPD